MGKIVENEITIESKVNELAELRKSVLEMRRWQLIASKKPTTEHIRKKTEAEIEVDKRLRRCK